MKRFLIKLIVIIVLLFVADKSLWSVINDASNRTYDKRLEKVITGEINKDVIVLGSSRGAGNILAGQIEKETGWSAYNLSYLGSDIHFHSYVLKTLLKHNKAPKKVLLATDGKFQFANDSALVFRYDKLYPLVKHKSILNKLQEDGKKSQVANWFYSLQVQLSHFNFKTENGPKINPVNSYGSKPYVYKSEATLKKNLTFNTEVEAYSVSTENKSKLEAFKEFQELCKQHQIELTVVIPPNYAVLNVAFANRIKSQLIPETKLYTYNTENPVYKDASYFYDMSHLYKNGAEVFTSEIIDFLKK